MTDDVLFLSGEQATRLLDADTALTAPGAVHPPARKTHPGRFDDSLVFAHHSRPHTGAVAKSRSANPGNTGNARVPAPATAAEHAGPVVDALGNGLRDADALTAREAATTGRRAVARTGSGDIVRCDSVGLGIQDAAAARAVVRSAEGERG
ncbi:hypothetical protein OHT57_40205 [Streptomyces sp. NBC_00285]|uniref:hypothetical protein n=1 Tax=Streptomyces sp. NBC_00285 TaxID=2975700 RepID=UPI002E2DA3B7|nr:hypothetical protein [Streptomyces sp. NBC_00285]